MALLEDLLRRRKLKGTARGIYSVCSAHPWVIRASVQQALADETPLLIEATSNQVNQMGGYTGMRPADFRELVLTIARDERFSEERLIFGGDHLGPNPWTTLPAEQAMVHAEAMLTEYAKAGFTKLHLDASMSCADDPERLPDHTVAERAARLCAAAERVASSERPVYIIGTEVPTPGGATEELDHLQVTSAAAATETLRVHQEVFREHGLEDVWSRVVALVVQPGVEFNHDAVVPYVPEKASGLASVLTANPGLVFEAHSTDYQLPAAYCDLVRDGFAILKVGPALTFAMREALFALEVVEAELIPEEQRSGLQRTVDDVMQRSPANWASHYAGNAHEQHLLRRFSYSDRIRYFWGDPAVQAATDRLIANLRTEPIPETLVSAYLPEQYHRYRAGLVPLDPLALVLDRIRGAIRPYSAACFPHTTADQLR